MKIEVSGLTEFRLGLDRFQDELPAVRERSGHKAADLTVRKARPGVPVRSGDAAGSLRVLDLSDGAAATGGSPSVPYFAWLNFGGDAGVRGSVHREVVPEGRYLHPAFLQKFVQIELGMEQELVIAVRRAGLS